MLRCGVGWVCQMSTVAPLRRGGIRREWGEPKRGRAMSERRCLQCNEGEAAVRESQRRGNPLYCGGVDYFGEATWVADRHRFRDWTDKELIEQWRVLPEHVDRYRRIFSGYEIAKEHRAPVPTESEGAP